MPSWKTHEDTLQHQRFKETFQETMKSVIIILGPTCAGKTGLSILLAKALDTEIISADSMQIYQHMDIGTAKPSATELKEVKHHLIDIMDPTESFSAGLFRDMAVRIINNLHERGKIPIVVGGTGLYIRTLTRGLFKGPSADWALREKLIEEEKIHGTGHLYERLRKIDPASADKINPADTRRIIRALEVSLKGKKAISELQRSFTTREPYEFIKIGLYRERKELYRMIEQRVDKMMEKGLVDEVRQVIELIGRESRLPSMQALGYKEMSSYLKDNIGLQDAIKIFKRRTKLFAKRQFTWFKKEPDISWVDITGLTEPEEILSKVINNIAILKKIFYLKNKKSAIC
jgi:tRNA dimethylallyltransferase